MAQTLFGDDPKKARIAMAVMAVSGAIVVIHFLAILMESAIEDIFSKTLACWAAVVLCVLAGTMPGAKTESFRKGYYKVLQVLLGTLMIFIVFPVVMQILSRSGYVPRYIWTEEIARFCFIWIIMIGAMIGAKEGIHFDVDLLPTPKTIKGKGLQRGFVDFAMMVIAVTFVIYGYDFAGTAVYQLSEISELPMIVIYIAWPITGLTWVIFIASRLQDDILRIRGIEPHPEGEEIITLEAKVKLEEVL